MNNLREVFRKYKAVVFFDVETTGLDAKTCRIIELAAIRIERAGDGTLYTAGRADMLISDDPVVWLSLPAVPGKV